MKNLNLATLGVEEMNDAQMQEVNGGEHTIMLDLGGVGCWLIWNGDGWAYAPLTGWMLA